MQALKIYKTLLDHTCEIAKSISVDRYLFYNNFIGENDKWPETHFKKLLQNGPGLGEKMKNAFQQVFQAHQKIVIIGSDCASLTKEIVNEAFEKLAKYPFVIGPAKDGGYYLLGMNQYSPEIFKNIAWSTSQVFPKTVEIIEHLSKTYYLLPVLSDIDTEEDWKKHGWKI